MKIYETFDDIIEQAKVYACLISLAYEMNDNEKIKKYTSIKINDDDRLNNNINND